VGTGTSKPAAEAGREGEAEAEAVLQGDLEGWAWMRNRLNCIAKPAKSTAMP
jgi:hypothetical protein